MFITISKQFINGTFWILKYYDCIEIKLKASIVPLWYIEKHRYIYKPSLHLYTKGC